MTLCLLADSELLRFAFHVFKINDTANGSSSNLQPGTCTIHSKVFYSKNIPWGSTECSRTTQESRWFDSMCGRKKDSLAFNQVKLSNRRCIAGVDLTQSIHRSPATHAFISGKKPVVVAPTIIPNSFIWLMFPPEGVVAERGDPPSSHASLPEERPLTGVEQMLLQGWPIHENLVDLEKHHNLLRDLSGNMFTGTVFLSVMMAFVFSVEWSNKSDSGNVVDEKECSVAVLRAVRRRRC